MGRRVGPRGGDWGAEVRKAHDAAAAEGLHATLDGLEPEAGSSSGAVKLKVCGKHVGYSYHCCEACFYNFAEPMGIQRAKSESG